MQKDNDYRNQTDEALIGELRSGREEITDYIMEKYKNLVRKRADSGGDDWIVQGNPGF